MQRLVSSRSSVRVPHRGSSRTAEIILLEDNATTAERRCHAGVGSSDAGSTITIRVHQFADSKRVVAGRKTYETGALRSNRTTRIDLALRLLDRVTDGRNAVVVAGASYGTADAFLTDLAQRGLPFVVQIRPSKHVSLCGDRENPVAVADLLSEARWRELTTVMPDGRKVPWLASRLGTVAFQGARATLFAAQIGSIEGLHRGTIIGLASFKADLPELVRLVGYSRWIRGALRRTKRKTNSALGGAEPTGQASALTARANIAIARPAVPGFARARGDGFLGIRQCVRVGDTVQLSRHPSA